MPQSGLKTGPKSASGGGFNPEFGAGDSGHTDLSARRHVGTGHDPAAVAQRYAATAVQDRLIEHEGAAHHRLAALVERRLAAAALQAAQRPAQQHRRHYRNDGEDE